MEGIIFHNDYTEEVIEIIENLKKEYESKLAKYNAYFVHDFTFYPIKNSDYFEIPTMRIRIDCGVKYMSGRIEWDNDNGNTNAKENIRISYPNETTYDEMFNVVDCMENITKCVNIFHDFLSKLRYVEKTHGYAKR